MSLYTYTKSQLSVHFCMHKSNRSDIHMQNYRSRELLFEFSDNSNWVIEENNMPGSDEIIHSSSDFLTDETGGDVTEKKQMVREEYLSGYKVHFIMKGTLVKIDSKAQSQQSKASYLQPLM